MLTPPKIGQNKIINDCLKVFEKSLVVNFKKALTKTLSKLFDNAEHAESNQQEVMLFEQYNLLKKSSDKLLNTLSVVIKSMPDEITEQISLDEQEVKLSLIEDEVLEISLSFTQLESVLDIRYSNFLFALEKRLNILFSTRKINKDNMPFGVASICWILSQTFENSDSNVATKVILIEFLKQQLGSGLLEPYKKIDKIFVKAGILPNIKLERKPVQNKGATARPSEQGQAGSSDQKDKSHENYRDPGQTGGSGNAGGYGDTDQLAGSSSFGQTNDGLSNNSNRSDSGELVNSIFDLMNKGRMYESQQEHLSNINNVVLDQTLENLSKVTSIAAGSTEIDKLKEMIIDDVRNETGVFYPGLNKTQQNSMDVMGMFYDHVKQDESIDSNILSSLNALNIPLIRTAMKDNKFFSNVEHPARQYLEKIIYAAQKWHGTPVVKKLHQFSSHLASDYDGSNDSFNSANEDLENFLKLTENRAKKSEEKWVKSAKGKEKLDFSRIKVEGIVKNIAEIAKPNFIKNIIKYVVQDALTLSLLRNGEGSDEWNEKVAMSETIAKMANSKEIKKLTPKQKIESIHHLDETMDDLGFSDNDRKATIQNIHECAQAASLNKLDKDIDMINVVSINKNKENFKKAASAKIEEIRELSSIEKTQLTKIRLMPYGTLFDFITNQQRDKIRRRLSWFSPVSNKALFVSLLGNKPFEQSLKAIAIDLARNNILIVKFEEKKYFNKVLKTVFSKLKAIVN